ncbi:MAG: filamentous hemagglutinin N-terminal domain-containing protein, partial [Alphaproteobacteria bacterium]|nr:filamentous hemagglutinin N-terminal domain-containing protein [Alphaproteobacteria bacterium]
MHQPMKSAETARRAGWTFRSILLASTALIHPVAVGMSLLVLGAGPVLALPQGGTVAGGAATIVQTTPKTLTINQSTQNAILNWQSFNIAPNETTRFKQPSASSFTLNRITGGDPAKILGTLSANGGIMIVDPNGVIFGPGSRVDVNRIVASTADIKNKDFMAGNYNFATPGNINAIIVNQGNVTVADSGLAAFVAPGVANSGVIVARLGKVSLASANTFTLDLYGDRLVNVAVSGQVLQQLTGLDGKPLQANVQNSGKILADGGQVVLSASAAREAVNEVVNSNGVIQARTASLQGGDIILDGGEGGTVAVSGTLDATGKGAGQTGGTVTVTGQNVALAGTAVLDTSGNAGGGTIKVGGGARGRDAAVRNANTTTIASGAQISADALDNGNGGSVAVWSNTQTVVAGTLTAKGGTRGGTVETSSAGKLDVNNAQVSTVAPKGKTGIWVLDPADFTIAATGGDISGASLSTSLLSNSVTIQSSQGTVNANGSGDVNVNDTVSWAGTNSLTLSAYRNINVNSSIVSTSGALFLTPNQANATSITTPGYTGSVNFLSGVSVPTNTNIFYTNPNAFTIALTGGNLTGAQLAGELALANVTINNVTNNTGDITVNDAVSWSSAKTLTLNANRNIIIGVGANASLTATGTPANGSLITLQAATGAVTFGTGATVPSNLTISYSSTGDYTIAASGGNLTGALLDNYLIHANVIINNGGGNYLSSASASLTGSTIFISNPNATGGIQVNDAVLGAYNSSHTDTLVLSAKSNIAVNQFIEEVSNLVLMPGVQGGVVTIGAGGSVPTNNFTSTSIVYVPTATFTLAASAGNLTSAQLGNELALAHVTKVIIDSSAASAADIVVSNGVTWSGAPTLNLNSGRNIALNASLSGASNSLSLNVANGWVSLGNGVTLPANTTLTYTPTANFTVATSGGNVTGAMLASDLAVANVTISNSGANITVNDAVSWTSSNSFSAYAGGNIGVNAAIAGSNASVYLSAGGMNQPGVVTFGTNGSAVSTNTTIAMASPASFTIAASGGNLSGAALDGDLAYGNVTITSNYSGSNSNSVILVNDSLSWSSAHSLKLYAYSTNNVGVGINAPMFASTGNITLYTQNNSIVTFGSGASVPTSLTIDFLNTGTYTIAASGGSLATTLLDNYLALANVEVTTGAYVNSGGSSPTIILASASPGNADIVVSNPLSWTSANALTLNSGGNVFVNASMTANTAGATVNLSPLSGPGGVVTFGTGVTVPTNTTIIYTPTTSFTIAPSGGNLTGAVLNNELALANVNILTNTQTAASITVNDALSWSSSKKLKLIAGANNINLNASTAPVVSGSGKFDMLESTGQVSFANSAAMPSSTFIKFYPSANYLIASTAGNMTPTVLDGYLARANVVIDSTFLATGASITVNEMVSWTTARSLSLIAGTGNININAGINSVGTGGSLALNVTSGMVNFGTSGVYTPSATYITYTPTGSVNLAASGSGLTTTQLLSNLAQGNVTIDNSATGTGDITVSDPLSWTTSRSLTLNAGRNLSVNAAITTVDASANVNLSVTNGLLTFGSAITAMPANTYLTLAPTTGFIIAASGGNLSTAQLDGYLALGNVTISNSATSGADIVVNDPVSWSGLQMLHLDAGRDITINAPLTASGAPSGEALVNLTPGSGTVNLASGVGIPSSVNVFFNSSGSLTVAASGGNLTPTLLDRTLEQANVIINNNSSHILNLNGTTVYVTNINTGDTASDILVNDPVSWSNAHGLVLGAGGNIFVNAGITAGASFGPMVQMTAALVTFGTGVSVPTQTTVAYYGPSTYTVAPSGGSLTGLALSNDLANASVTIDNTGSSTCNIVVNDGVSWSGKQSLTLSAASNIVINNTITASLGALNLNPNSTNGVVSFGSGASVPSNTFVNYYPGSNFLIADTGGNLTSTQLDAELAFAQVNINSSATTDITLSNALSWNSSQSLDLNAGNNIAINANITANSGSVNLATPIGVVSFASGITMPSNVNVAYTPSSNFTVATGGSLTASQLDNNLALANVTIRNDSCSCDILVNDMVSWSSSSNLSLFSGRDIGINSSLAAGNSAAAVNLNAHNGVVRFASSGISIPANTVVNYFTQSGFIVGAAATTAGNLSGADLSNDLSYANVNVDTTANSAADILVNDPVSWTGNHMLNLSAGRNIGINSSLTSTGPANSMNINLNVATGMVTFGSGASVPSNLSIHETVTGTTGFTIAASGGDLSGVQLDGYLALANVEIDSAPSTSTSNGPNGTGNNLSTIFISNGTTSLPAGNIAVNDGVSWANTSSLALVAGNNLQVNAPIAASNGKASLFLDTIGGKVTFSTNGAAPANTNITYLPQNSYVIASSGGDLTTSLLQSNLALGNVTIDNSSISSGDLTLNSPVSWSGARTLSLSAGHNVLVNANVTATSPGAAFDMETVGGGISFNTGVTLTVPNVNIGYIPSGVFSIATSGGNLTPSALAADLAVANVAIDNTNGPNFNGNGTGDITVSNDVSWGSAHSLGIRSAGAINLNAALAASNPAAFVQLNASQGNLVNFGSAAAVPAKTMIDLSFNHSATIGSAGDITPSALYTELAHAAVAVGANDSSGNTVTVNSPLSWTGTSPLFLYANGNVYINANISTSAALVLLPGRSGGGGGGDAQAPNTIASLGSGVSVPASTSVNYYSFNTFTIGSSASGSGLLSAAALDSELAFANVRINSSGINTNKISNFGIGNSAIIADITGTPSNAINPTAGILLNSALSWNSGHTLYLIAGNGVQLNAGITGNSSVVVNSGLGQVSFASFIGLPANLTIDYTASGAYTIAGSGGNITPSQLDSYLAMANVEIDNDPTPLNPST